MVDLDRFKVLVKEKLNINLFLYKEEQLDRRLKSYFTRNKIDDLDEYARKIASDKAEKEKFLDYVTINVTEFYRNPELYRDLSKVIQSRGNQNLKIWSAACSNGAEPYSIAIMLTELGFSSFTIHATDLDPNIIKRAKEGIYDEIEIRSLPKDLLNKYFTKKKDKYYILDSLKKNVSFKVHDLLMDKFEKDYDLVLCRNVVIYFNADAKDMLYEKISNSIKPSGLFFVGATENIHDYTRYNFDKVSSFIYKKK